MAVSSFLRSLRGGSADNEKQASAAVPDVEGEKGVVTDDVAAADSIEDLRPGDDLQRGVQQVEAVTLSWSKATLIGVFIKYVVVVCFGLVFCVFCLPRDTR